MSEFKTLYELDVKPGDTVRAFGSVRAFDMYGLCTYGRPVRIGKVFPWGEILNDKGSLLNSDSPIWEKVESSRAI